MDSQIIDWLFELNRIPRKEWPKDLVDMLNQLGVFDRLESGNRITGSNADPLVVRPIQNWLMSVEGQQLMRDLLRKRRKKQVSQ